MKNFLQAISILVVGFSLVTLLPGCGGAKKQKVDVSAQVEMLKSNDPGKKSDALATLSQAGADAAPAIPVLIETLKDPDPLNRRLAALTLGNIGKPAASAVPSLKALLADQDRAVVTTAVNALRNIDPTSAPENMPNVTTAAPQ